LNRDLALARHWRDNRRMSIPGSPAWRRQVARTLAAEAKESERWWYLSFADASGFRGAVVVQSRGKLGALTRTHELGINPGGEVLSIDLPEDVTVPAQAANRLLSREEVERIFGESKTLGEYSDDETAAEVRS
jgi:hypothetical protein